MEIANTTIDLGNYNIKATGEKEETFSAKISTDYQAYQDGFQRIEFNGRVTYIGIGELSREFNKSNRDYMATLLYGICKVNKGDIIQTNLSLLLPSLQMENKTKLIEDLKGKEFDLKFNGIDKIVKINDILVLPEGYASYFALKPEDKKGDVAIIDLGSRTINICILLNGKIQKLQTVKLGSFDLYSKIKSQEAGKGEDYVEEDIERLINNGTIKVFQKQYAEFLNEILNSIKPYANLKTYKCIFTGGTSLMLQECINKLPLPNFKILENALTSNVQGAKIASDLMWNVNKEAV